MVGSPPAARTPAAPAAPAARSYEIDGIRGWAAFLIVLFHVYWEMLGMVLPGARSAWLGTLLNDRLAIVSFFVLSGDSLASAYFHRGAGRSLPWQLLRRYIRLTVPVLLASGLVYVLLALQLDWHREAASIVGVQHWMGSFLNFEPSLIGFLRYCLWDVYWTTSAERAYNPFLWTMQVELLGSLFIYGICALWPRLPRPTLWVLALTLGLALTLPLMAAFSLGFLFSYARSQGWMEAARRHPTWQWLVLLAIPASIVISSFRPGVRTGLIVAAMLLTCFHTQRYFQRFFDNGLSRWLGWVSFPMYLMQFPVLISLMSGLIVAQSGPGGQPPAAGTLMWISALTVAACVVAARLFVPVEGWCRQAAEALLLSAPTRAVRTWRARRLPQTVTPASRLD